MIKKIDIEMAEYPKLLKNIHKPPNILYLNGSFEKEDENVVAIVGSRRASRYGLEMGEKLAYELALRGVTIVSGMARGIDSAAHKGALKAKGRTIAVMGSGHDHIYPPENKDLYERIANAGVVVSEFENDMAPLPKNFPIRNRIISGLSLGVVVVEAAKNSGALITADFALEQGREVFAVPGKISSLTSAGTHDLIKDGAKLVQTADDIMEELKLHIIEPMTGEKKYLRDDLINSKTGAYICNSLTDDERRVYKTLSDEPLYIDDIIKETKVGIGKIAKALLNLELKRLIKELPGKQFVRLRIHQEIN
ncbi:MAG: DNA protecting protein DprA [Omnitrophica bacterium RIFCSPLOWO2_02_FULL_45_16]|nr:MAG: DNA protecting protein DprA [Omnitrophica bacterium RIFCSPLOWO2_12_FULL_45_13]OGW94504.1 MAG: DNA protecting protein DprA [Omnitrophica bacterium RIFCSPLOWO2_01_FULL_45_24]OGW99982.1 MAG: DNA protecting protein DprA [Omnitrophica bacterium RIFCSPLOWO2_02_FULL_45_16]